MIKVALSLPPSVNSLYANVGRKRVKTAKARRWHDTAAWQIKLAAGRIRIEGPWAIGVVLPRSMRGDCDNRLKPILDAAVASGCVIDDSHCMGVTVTRTGEATDSAVITITEAT